LDDCQHQFSVSWDVFFLHLVFWGYVPLEEAWFAPQSVSERLRKEWKRAGYLDKELI
jgi:hypothetical protein